MGYIRIRESPTVRCGACAWLVAAAVVGMRPASAAEWYKKFDGPVPALLRLETITGDLSVRGGDISWIEARVTTSGWNIGPGGAEVLDRLTAAVLDLGVQVPREFFGIGERSIRIDVIVPRRMNVVVRTGEGAISADNFGGDVQLITESGRIDAIHLDGALDARSGDGALHFTGRFDRLNLRTTDGTIDGTIAAGSTIAAKPSWRVYNGNGPIHLQIPPGLKCNLDVRTGEGEVTVDLPADGVHQAGAPAVRARLNSGGPSFSVRTRGGDIGIRENR